MIILILYAFIAGIVTILAPCIWPLLPIILSSSSTGGKRKPIGISLGVMITFGFFTLTISYLEKVVPIDTNIFRICAAFLIAFLGLTLLIPKINEKIEGIISRISSQFFPKAQKSTTGFLNGLITGFSLGIVWTPCSGPIFATIATLAATQKVNLNVIFITLAYIIGIGLPLFILTTLGTKFFQNIKVVNHHLDFIQKVFGIIVLLSAFGILTNFDKVVYANILNYFPSYTNALTSIEKNNFVENQLNILKGNSQSDSKGEAPDFIGITKWLNTDKSIHISDLKGKVVLVDFWTYTCINCIRTLPHLSSWYDTYKKDGFIVIGVHTPEFDFEKSSENVSQAIKQFNIHYPIAQDNNYQTWNNYNNQYWPAEYLIDSSGNIRETHFGEGNYDDTERSIRSLLQEKDKKIFSKSKKITNLTPQELLTPETYLNLQRGEKTISNTLVVGGDQFFSPERDPFLNEYLLKGEWNIGDEYITPKKDAILKIHFHASKVYLVITPLADKIDIPLLLDDKRITLDQSGKDVENSMVKIDSSRLFNLLDLKDKSEDHILELNVSNAKIQLYVFTFG